MPETREWPPALRRLAKVSLGIIYTGSAVAGWHVVLAPEHATAPWWSVGLGWVAGVGGVLALSAMLKEWWMAERPSAWLVALSLSVYAVIDATRLLFAIARAGVEVLRREPTAVNVLTSGPWVDTAWPALLRALVTSRDLVVALMSSPTGAVDVGGTALLWVSAAAVGLRIVHLWAFDLNLHRAKERAEAARRARRVRDELEHST